VIRYCGNRIFDPSSYPADKMCGKDARFVVRSKKDSPDLPTGFMLKGEIILYLCADCRMGWTEGQLTAVEELPA